VPVTNGPQAAAPLPWMDGGVAVEVEVRLENVCRYLVEKNK
jgi:hypothetical protein